MAQKILALNSAAESGEAVKAPITRRTGMHNNNKTPIKAKTLLVFFKINPLFQNKIKIVVLFSSIN